MIAIAGPQTQSRPIRPLDAAAQALASDPRHIALARRLAYRASRISGAPVDAMVSAALLGLCLASRDFDPERGHRFVTFAYHRIVGSMKDEGQAWRFGKRDGSEVRLTSLDRVAVEFELRDESLHGLFAADEEPVEDIIAIGESIEHFINKLPDRHRSIMRAIYLDPANRGLFVRAASSLGISPNRVSQLHAEAIAMLRETAPEPPPPPKPVVSLNAIGSGWGGDHPLFPSRDARGAGRPRSEYRGVTFRRPAWWVARINRGDWKTHVIGKFRDPVEAARAYDREAIKCLGSRARLNFPEAVTTTD